MTAHLAEWRVVAEFVQKRKQPVAPHLPRSFGLLQILTAGTE
jgi:hypothetical protein